MGEYGEACNPKDLNCNVFASFGKLMLLAQRPLIFVIGIRNFDISSPNTQNECQNMEIYELMLLWIGNSP